MKREYIKPFTEVVKVRLFGSVLGLTVGVDNTSKYGKWEDDAKKNNLFGTEDEPVSTVGSTARKSVWED